MKTTIDKARAIKIFNETKHLFSLCENELPYEDSEWYLAIVRALIESLPEPEEEHRVPR